MLDQYLPNISSQEDLELIKELFAECNRLRPTVFKLAADTQHNDDLLSMTLAYHFYYPSIGCDFIFIFHNFR